MQVYRLLKSQYMHCLVAAATATELKPFLDQYRSGLQLACTVDVLITGVGLTAATYSLTRQIGLKRPDIIVQAGVAGCFDPSVPKGTVVVVKKEAIADQGVTEQAMLKTLFDLKLAQRNQYPYTNGWLVNKSSILAATRLRKVTGISVNEITTSSKKIAQYRQAFSPVVESMEGAALHYTGLMEKIPFIQLRGISNVVGERNKQRWNMQEAILNLNNELLRLLTML